MIVSSLRATLTIFDNLDGSLSQLKVWGVMCQFDGSLMGVYRLFPNNNNKNKIKSAM
jgi:hypothetical protein